MLRDFKFLRRNSGKNPNFEEPENVPVNVNLQESSVSQMGTDSSSRPPLNTIQEPVQNPRKHDQESEVRSTKTDQTPTKAKGSRQSESGMPMKTPEKQRGLARNRYGWGSDSRDEGRTGNVNTPRSCRTVGRAVSSGYSECNSTQTTPTKSVSKPPNPGMHYGGSSRPPSSAGSARHGNFAALSRGFPATCTVNTVEVSHFDLREDPSFWMDHNVQVLIRIRPLNSMEISTQGYNRCLKQESAQSLTWVGHPETRFTFDHVACETIDQETLFRMVGLPMVENCLSGYNSCMFAYGQTGSGKTHTMLGEINELELKPSPYRGMTPRMFEFLFARIIAEEESRRDEKLAYNCKCSFLEIYNEQITDLLDPSSTNLQLREDVKKGVYVENLSEYEVHTVRDILRLLSQGSANRRVAATNMNRESSRSHSVFTCVIESRWEKDTTSNLRFARLNLVDLAGSERQKASGAEGERLKEAANINKSLSTLGHVIMVLVDGVNARTRHVPYRDSRLTFLLQDSLGGNSKTMIIANVSPSMCSATETLNTLKFAQRAKLIQNNAVVNEDASGDVVALQNQIKLLKEELAVLKRHNISRSLTYEEARQEPRNDCDMSALGTCQQRDDNAVGHENKVLRISSKQLKSLETSLTGALRREQMTETSVKQLEAEIEQLNRLVRQREEDNKCTKMMLKFREDKIQRMESLAAGSIPADSYLLEENNMLAEEIRMLRAKTDRNPEVTRFAIENIRLLEQLRRFQDFYEEGEREMLLKEVSELRDQLVLFLDENSKHNDHTNTTTQKEAGHGNKESNALQLELKKTQEELEKCRSNMNSCLERNAKLCREITGLNALLERQKSAVQEHDDGIEVIKEPILEASSVGDRSCDRNEEIRVKPANDDRETEGIVAPVGGRLSNMEYAEVIMDLQLEIDILKVILKEERSSRGEAEETALRLTRNLNSAEEKLSSLAKRYEDSKTELDEAKSVIEALETQQLITINELEDLRRCNKELEIASLNDPPPSSNHEDSRLQEKLNKMKVSLEKARRMNTRYRTDQECVESNEEEMDEVRRQVEAETAAVIVCLQEELNGLQRQVNESRAKEGEIERELAVLREKYNEKDERFNRLSEEWDSLTEEIHDILATGHDALDDVTDSISGKRNRVLETIGRSVFEKESRITELHACLEDAKSRGNETEGMLRSLRAAALVMAEAHEREVHRLWSQLSEKSATIAQLESTVEQVETELDKSKESHMVKDSLLQNQTATIDEAEKQIQSLKNELETKDERYGKSIIQLSDEKKRVTCDQNGILSHKSSRDADTIVLLKKELETALESLKGVKTEMAKLRLSKEQSRKSVEFLVPQVLALQADFEEKIEAAMVSFDRKLKTVEELLRESRRSCLQKRKLYELELMDAKVSAAEQAAESSCILAKFAEAQYTVKEADVMINELVIANETAKRDVEALTRDRDTLRQNYEVLEKKFETDTIGMKGEVEELEGMVSQILVTVMPTVADFVGLKTQVHESSGLVRSWLEDVWSEIIARDCAVSVLRVCHMGILLETVTGLNAENGLLHHGLSESDSLVSWLRENNCRSRRELETCRMVQGKLLSDIKNSFDRVSRDAEETEKLSFKLMDFEKRIHGLRLQEEAMLERSNRMGSELHVLTKEMEASKAIEGIDQELRSIEDKCAVDLFAKEIEVLVMGSQRTDLAKEGTRMLSVLEKFKEDMIVCNVDSEFKDRIFLEKEAEATQSLEAKEAELRNMRIREEENEKLLTKLKAEFREVSRELEETKSELKRHEDHKIETFEKIASLDRNFREISGEMVRTSAIVEELECLGNLANEVVSENVGFQAELERKDEVLEGLVFDLRALQESLSNAKDQRDEMEELAASLAALEAELDENTANRQVLEDELKQKTATIGGLEAEVNSLVSEIHTLTENVENTLKAKESIETELAAKNKANESLEIELVQAETTLDEMKTLIESLRNELRKVTRERDDVNAELFDARKELEMAQAVADENEAIATEAKQAAETNSRYAEEKDEEVKLYEKSVEELERTVNVLESQVVMVKEDAERQRSQREELELEFHAFKQQIHTVASSDSDMKRQLNEKEKRLHEALERVQILEKEIASMDAEIVQHKAHISELNLHAEAQAREYKQTFKALEAMADQVKPDGAVAPHVSNSPSKRLEKNGSRSRGSGSPFKCIGMGLVQQMKSERDEELASARSRIVELEALAAARQKEIFALNAKLAMSGSMTHDVLRDLLGIKLDMTTYSSMVDDRQIKEMTETAQVHDTEAQSKDQEVIELKRQLNEFVAERKGWLEEIERKQSEVVAAQVALEQLRQRDCLLSTENEMFKTENANHKRKVVELEAEVRKLSGQQNLQQRIHHHTKIKEENNALKAQTDELSRKLQRTEAVLSRAKEELANTHAAANGNVPFDKKLDEKLKETEEERLQLAQKLAVLCTRILKAAGVTRPPPNITIAMAEEALEQLHRRERESQDLRYKNRMSNERLRMPQTAEGNRQTNSRASQSPFLSSLDR